MTWCLDATNGIAQAKYRASSIATWALGIGLSLWLANSSTAEEATRRVEWPSAQHPAYPTSPYHGARDGDGRVIPCRCKFQGRDFRLGELVCMATPAGNQLSRCDLMLNNTSWVPTETPCTTSRLGPSSRVRFAISVGRN